MIFAQLRRHPFWQRLIALTGVTLIIAFSLLAVNSAAHEWVCAHHGNTLDNELHHACDGYGARHDGESASHTANHADDAAGGCIVTLFANGHVLGLLVALIALAILQPRLEQVFSEKKFVFSRMAHALPPGRAPPLS
ncbi:hypothetical protein OH491_01340 [Termitidicoccus mucosus]|uniref:hypothetical protein n=1 Tax=Termitidicoccus mucosus TaxID=1184151 RepID=UPI0011AB43AE